METTPQTPGTDPTQWLTAIQVARYLNVSRQTVDRYVKQGMITRYEFAGIRRFRRDEIDAAFRPATPE